MKQFFVRDDDDAIININDIIYISHDTSRNRDDKYHYKVYLRNTTVNPELSDNELKRLINIINNNVDSQITINQ